MVLIVVADDRTGSMEKINHLINRDITERLEQLDELTAEVGNFLALPVTGRVWPVLKNQRLTLFTDDSHLATQIRFQQQLLGKHLSKRLNLKISGVNIKLISFPLASKVRKNNRFCMSSQAVLVMQGIAGSMEDKELRQAILNLTAAAHRP
jgi:hypothetical protein